MAWPDSPSALPPSEPSVRLAHERTVNPSGPQELSPVLYTAILSPALRSLPEAGPAGGGAHPLPGTGVTAGQWGSRQERGQPPASKARTHRGQRLEPCPKSPDTSEGHPLLACCQSTCRAPALAEPRQGTGPPDGALTRSLMCTDQYIRGCYLYTYIHT